MTFLCRAFKGNVMLDLAGCRESLDFAVKTNRRFGPPHLRFIKLLT
jgi:hypothetical protein